MRHRCVGRTRPFHTKNCNAAGISHNMECKTVICCHVLGRLPAGIRLAFPGYPMHVACNDEREIMYEFSTHHHHHHHLSLSSASSSSVIINGLRTCDSFIIFTAHVFLILKEQGLRSERCQPLHACSAVYARSSNAAIASHVRLDVHAVLENDMQNQIRIHVVL